MIWRQKCGPGFHAIVDSRMGSRLLELHTNDKTAVPAGDELIEFCDQREHILSLSEECSQDPRPQFYRRNFKASPTSSNKRYSKSSLALHNVDVSNCRLCQTLCNVQGSGSSSSSKDSAIIAVLFQLSRIFAYCPSVHKPTFMQQGLWQQTSHSPVPLGGC